MWEVLGRFDRQALKMALALLPVERKYEHLVVTGNLASEIHQLIDVAERDGWIDELISIVPEHTEGGRRAREILAKATERERLYGTSPELAENSDTASVEADEAQLPGYARSATSPEYDQSIRRFWRYYIGDEEDPVPFGGRDKELSELATWLKQPDAAPRLLITAVAGRGKTSLLAHWIKAIPTQQWRVVFAPISNRFETNQPAIVYEALAHQLARIAGERAGHFTHDLDRSYRARCLELLDRINAGTVPTLMIIDGLDETGGWSFSRNILAASGRMLRIVVSARRLMGDSADGRDWLDRIEWPHSTDRTKVLTVEPLSQEGVAQAVASMGPAAEPIAAKASTLAELVRLTQGEPLLVRQYAQMLGIEPGRTEAADLAGLESGYAGFFRHWFETQVGSPATDGHWANAVEVPLAVLTAAQGPLLHRDLERICAIATKDDAFHLSVAALQPLQRFLIGDGVSTGYTFQHPKFAEYFQTEYFKGGSMHNALAGIVTWCRSIVDGDARPDEIPDYVRNHYVSHLVAARAAPDAFEAILASRWQQIWLEQDAGTIRYVTDVETVKGYFRDAHHFEKGKRFAIMMRAALILSSLQSVGANIPWQLLTLLIRNGRMSVRQALHQLLRQDGSAQLYGLPPLFAVADPTTRKLILSEVEAFGSVRWYAEAFVGIAVQLPPAERSAILERMLSEIADLAEAESTYSSLYVGYVVEVLTAERDADLLMQCLSLTGSLESNFDQASLVKKIAERLSPECPLDLWSRTLSVVEKISESYWRSEALVSIAERVSPGHGAELVWRMVTIAGGLDDGADRATAFAAIARLIEPGHALCAIVLQAVEAISAEDDRALAARICARATVGDRFPPDRRADILSNAISAANGIGDLWPRAKVLLTVAELLRREGDAGLASALLSAAASIPWDDGAHARVKAVIAIAEHLDADHRTRVLADAVGAIGQLQRGNDKPYPLDVCATNFDPVRDEALLFRVLAIAQTVNEDARAKVLAAIAMRLAPDQDALGSRVIAMAEELSRLTTSSSTIAAIAKQFPAQRTTGLLSRQLPGPEEVDKLTGLFSLGLSELAGCLSPRDQPELVLRMLSFAAAKEYHKARIIAAIAEKLAVEPNETLEKRALAVAETIGWPHSAVDSLVALGRCLEGDGRAQIILKAVNLAKSAADGWTRRNNLARIRGYLDPARDANILTEIPTLEEPSMESDDEVRALFGNLGTQPDNQREQSITRLLDLAEMPQLRSVYPRDVIIQTAASYCPKPCAVALIQRIDLLLVDIKDEQPKAKAYAALARATAGDNTRYISLALDAAAKIGSDATRDTLLPDIVGLVTPEHDSQLVAKALRAVEAMDWERYRALALASIAGCLPRTERLSTLSLALSAAQQTGSEEDTFNGLSNVLQSMAKEDASDIIPGALEIANGLEYPEWRCRALAEISTRLAADQRDTLLTQVLELAETEDDWTISRIINAVVGHLKPELVSGLLDRLPNHIARLERPQALSLLASCAPYIYSNYGESVTLDIAQTIGDVCDRWPYHSDRP
ncbi:hypothetical protein VW23_001760 [Devosia insulae DS-56]|uniref:Orc1-like AAA ATPase domain-containing protein n=1 Tax=Devosia insulae DS-56 TaxID=1116389 RepID=A0A1E5XMG7_9HYPH|nr:hypothetical protein VW23_001760 [Devosia insulae DS-56]